MYKSTDYVQRAAIRPSAHSKQILHFELLLAAKPTQFLRQAHSNTWRTWTSILH